MSDMIPFSFASHEVRVVMLEQSPWWIAMDVSSVLDYSDAEAMTRRLDDDEVQNLQIVGFGPRGVTVINESGLYSAILGSRKPDSKKFKKWVTSEVLPAIRRTGSYSLGQPSVQLDYSRLAKLVAAELTAAAPARFGVQKIDPVDAEFEQVKTYVKNLRFITTSEIVDDLGLRASKFRVGRWLKRLGFFCVLQREYDGPIRVWFKA